jgi:predicted MFS family arabinose efflux permease
MTPGVSSWRGSLRVFVVGQTVNGLGSMVSSVALPLLAVYRLGATTFEVGALEAVEWIPAVVLGLLAGALVDRHHQHCRAIMMAANLGQAAAVAAVPVTAATGALSFGVLLGAAVTAGVFGVFFAAGYQPFLRTLVPEDAYVSATSALQAGRSTARISGPALGGALVGAIGATSTLITDAASFLVSFASLILVTTTTSQPAAVAPTDRPGALRRQIRDGLTHLRADKLLLTIAGASAGANLWLTAIGAVEVVFLVRDVHVPAAAIGALFALSGVGGLAGALAVRRLTKRIGLSRIARGALAATAPAALLIPLTQHGAGVVLFALAAPVVSFGIAMASITFHTLQLERCPPTLLGRVTASSRVLTAATIPTGALAGGALGQLLGPRPALLTMVHSPLRDTENRQRQTPVAQLPPPQHTTTVHDLNDAASKANSTVP